MDPHEQPEQENIQDVFASIPQSLICKFTTHLTEFSMDDAEIDISTDYDEEAFNKILRGFLENTIDQQTLDKISFDFLVEGKLLRGKVKSHIVRYDISCEKVIQIEYFIAFKNLEQMTENPEEDWVSAICAVMGVQENIGVFTSMFDGTVSFHTGKTSKKISKDHSKIHRDPIKAIKTLPSPQPGTYYAITGGLGEQIKVSTFSQGSSFSQISMNEQRGSVLAIDVNPMLDGHFCSVGSEGFVCIYKIPEDFMEQDYNDLSTVKNKKKKTNAKTIPRVVEEPNHYGSPINSVSWFNSNQMATGSSDHSIKIIDVTTMRAFKTILTKDSITTGIDFSNGCLVSSHEDGYIRLWDVRNPTSPASTFKSHSKYASCVSFGFSSNIFASGSYDQTVKIWDTRSVFPLQSIPTNYDKVFALSWVNQGTIASGGSNPFVTFHSI